MMTLSVVLAAALSAAPAASEALAVGHPGDTARAVAAPVDASAGTQFRATIRRTAYGVAHIEAGPQADAILTYGQSGDPESEHFTDQTEMFSRKEWRPVLFRPEDVVAGTLREYTVVGEGGAAGAGSWRSTR